VIERAAGGSFGRKAKSSARLGIGHAVPMDAQLRPQGNNEDWIASGDDMSPLHTSSNPEGISTAPKCAM
jgi:hypothetical protein